ncbi:hypothetical protein TGMAS_415110 [Toxoplasma gondii MAS]|uniref:Uncharacterized protein n=1 Tax=Toxoplasma gondii MAS TaxID=943118 RepID=A0A086QEJ6_TOXGO|nr:hypothetical protein TGMAS_415110 [Toxoplasma gondii MAS]
MNFSVLPLFCFPPGPQFLSLFLSLLSPKCSSIPFFSLFLHRSPNLSASLSCRLVLLFLSFGCVSFSTRKREKRVFGDPVYAHLFDKQNRSFVKKKPLLKPRNLLLNRNSAGQMRTHILFARFLPRGFSVTAMVSWKVDLPWSSSPENRRRSCCAARGRRNVRLRPVVHTVLYGRSEEASCCRLASREAGNAEDATHKASSIGI